MEVEFRKLLLKKLSFYTDERTMNRIEYLKKEIKRVESYMDIPEHEHFWMKMVYRRRKLKEELERELVEDFEGDHDALACQRNKRH